MRSLKPLLHLPRLCAGITASRAAGYGWPDLRRDTLAGLTVGIVALPLAMALAIATGVAPQHGLYTAMVAGAVIAITGGSRYSVSGPTAAFVVILLPIVQQHGLGGLLLATLMAGGILVAMGVARLGAFIEFVPYPVVLGFTAGIAVVIATLQLPDFLGLDIARLGTHYSENLLLIARQFPTMDPAEAGVGMFTLAVLLLWPRLRLPVPAPLIGLVAGALCGYALSAWAGANVETVASRFTWEANGQSGQGIPPLAPQFVIPWQLPGADGAPLVVNFELFRALLGPAAAIAMLGAIESLLCAVVADGMTRTRHDPNSELIGQGLGNIAVPFFGGITATAALARTATNIRSGARSPLAAVVHALVILLAVVAFAPLLSRVPMAALAALLLVIAWNMAEPRRVLRSLRAAPPEEAVLLLVCFGLTVFFDMVVAVAVGTGLASALFIRRMALSTSSGRMPAPAGPAADADPAIVAYDVNGPLFFGAAERAMSALRVVDPAVRVVIVDLRDVPTIDGTALVALKNLVDDMHQRGVKLIFTGVPARRILKLRRAGIRRLPERLAFATSIESARTRAERWLCGSKR